MRALRGLVLVAVALAAPLAAQASGKVERVELRERGAFAEWQYVDDAGTQTFVNVIVSESAREPGTGNAPAPALAVSVFSVDADGFVVFSGTGVTETFDFTSSNGLNGAHAAGTVIVADEGQGTSESFNVDVTWEPAGGTTPTHGHSHFHEDGFISHFQFSGLQRPSNADGTVFGKGVEWAPIPATAALMLRNTAGSVTIIVE